MDKIWYIEIQGKADGPWSVEDLKRDRRITPDTRVWRQGFTKWMPIRDVPELQELFKDESEQPKDVENYYQKRPSKIPVDDLIVLEMQMHPPYLFWFLVAVIVLFYVFIHLYWSHE